jgi:peptidylprolyl isomerase
MYKKTILAFMAGCMMFSAISVAQAAENLVLETTKGNVVIRLRPDLAPRHVERLKLLANEGFYNGVPFHRVMEGFMAQTGDPTGTGSGGSKYPDLKAEFTQEPFVRGTVGMARTSAPDTANSQFFICFQPASFLNGTYTVVGEVVEGMSAVDGLKRGTGSSGMVSAPDRVLKARISSNGTGNE